MYAQKGGNSINKQQQKTTTRSVKRQTLPLYNNNMKTAISTLNDKQRYRLIRLFAEGYTARYIANTINEEFDVELTDSDVLVGGVQFGADIGKLQMEIGQAALYTGLADKRVRIARLNRLAERIEPAEEEEISLKKVKSYLDIVKAIKDEVEPLGIRVYVSDEDPWVKILSEMKHLDQAAELSKESSTNSNSTPALSSGTSSEPVTEES